MPAATRRWAFSFDHPGSHVAFLHAPGSSGRTVLVLGASCGTLMYVDIRSAQLLRHARFQLLASKPNDQKVAMTNDEASESPCEPLPTSERGYLHVPRTDGRWTR